MKYSLRNLKYPLNFIVDVLNHDTKKMMDISRGLIPYPKDPSDIVIYRQYGLEFVLSCLTKEQNELIYLRYVENRSVTWISHNYGTRSYIVESSLQKIRSKLTHPKRFQYLLYDISKDNVIHVSFDEEEFNKICMDDFIDVLDITDRTRNALCRNGIYTIDDILKIMNSKVKKKNWYDRLLKIGKASSDEIIRELDRADLLPEGIVKCNV